MTMTHDAGFLVILSGLPVTGKTTIARDLALAMGATHLRIDTIEQALRDSGRLSSDLWNAGYRVAYAVAADNLRLGRTVIADSVNPVEATRQAWREVATGSGAKYLQVEVICSDAVEHRRRVETRVSDVPGLKLPVWEDVIRREYQPWQNQGVVIVDTAAFSAAEAAEVLRGVVAELGSRP